MGPGPLYYAALREAVLRNEARPTRDIYFDPDTYQKVWYPSTRTIMAPLGKGFVDRDTRASISYRVI